MHPFLRASLLVSSLALLAGCGPGGDDDSTPNGDTSVSVTRTTTSGARPAESLWQDEVTLSQGIATLVRTGGSQVIGSGTHAFALSASAWSDLSQQAKTLQSSGAIYTTSATLERLLGGGMSRLTITVPGSASEASLIATDPNQNCWSGASAQTLAAAIDQVVSDHGYGQHYVNSN